jgi:hypothetical protein
MICTQFHGLIITREKALVRFKNAYNWGYLLCVCTTRMLIWIHPLFFLKFLVFTAGGWIYFILSNCALLENLCTICSFSLITKVYWVIISKVQERNHISQPLKQHSLDLSSHLVVFKRIT